MSCYFETPNRGKNSSKCLQAVVRLEHVVPLDIINPQIWYGDPRRKHSRQDGKDAPGALRGFLITKTVPAGALKLSQFHKVPIKGRHWFGVC